MTLHPISNPFTRASENFSKQTLSLAPYPYTTTHGRRAEVRKSSLLTSIQPYSVTGALTNTKSSLRSPRLSPAPHGQGSLLSSKAGLLRNSVACHRDNIVIQPSRHTPHHTIQHTETGAGRPRLPPLQANIARQSYDMVCYNTYMETYDSRGQ